MSPPSQTRTNSGTVRRRALRGSVLVLLGLVVLVAASMSTWYSIVNTETLTPTSGQASSSQTGLTFGPFTPCPNIVVFNAPAFTQNACAGSDLSLLYNTVRDIEVIGMGVGLLTGLLGLGLAIGRSLAQKISPNMVVVLALVATILLVAAPLALAVEQPAALQRAYGNFLTECWNETMPQNSGPNLTFVGSCRNVPGNQSLPSVTYSDSWGPTSGWYLALVGAALYLLGSIELLRYRIGSHRLSKEEDPREDGSTGHDNELRGADTNPRTDTHSPDSPPSSGPR